MAKNRPLWALTLLFLFFGLCGAEFCGKAAKEQIDSARSAIEDARRAKAEEYAPTELRSAEDTLDDAIQLYDQWNFPKSEETAKRSEEWALAAKHKADQAYKEWLAELERRQRETDWEPQKPTPEELARMQLKMVHFEFDSSELTYSAREVLNNNAQFLVQNPSVRVKIEGHCDERGTDEYNLALGARRAKAVFEYMVKKGVSSSRMETISYGESLPLDTSGTERAWAMNRRANFAVIP